MTRGTSACRNSDAAHLLSVTVRLSSVENRVAPSGKVSIGKFAVRDTTHADDILVHPTSDFKSLWAPSENSAVIVTLGELREMGGSGTFFKARFWWGLG